MLNPDSIRLVSQLRTPMQDYEMKIFTIAFVLLLVLQNGAAILSNRRSCYKKPVKDRNCHDIRQERMRAIDSLKNHYWEGDECDVVCYCNLAELLCCPRAIFFGSIMSSVIPCKTENKL